MQTVSVIIPTYNRCNKVIKSVESVLYQTFPIHEVIIVDDGSTDSTKSFFTRIKNNYIKYIYIDHSGLPSVARNAGLEIASGEYIAFLDSDDFWFPNKLYEQMKQVKNYPEIPLFCCNAFVEKKDGYQKYYHNTVIPSSLWSYDLLIKNNIVITSSVIVKKDLLMSLGGFPEDKIFRSIEDYGLWLGVSLKSPLYYFNRPLLIYSDNGESIRAEINKTDYLIGIIKILDKLKTIYLFNNRKYTRITNKAQSKYYRSLSKLYLHNKNIVKSIECILKSTISYFNV